MASSGSGRLRVSFKRQACPPRGVYCCLIGNSLKNDREKETYVFLSNDPVYTTVLHNQRLTSVKETRSVAPFWHLVLVFGPFALASEALARAQHWVNVTRGCNSKIHRGMEIAREFKVPCYADHVKAPGGTLRYLKRHAPPQYVKTFRRLQRN